MFLELRFFELFLLGSGNQGKREIPPVPVRLTLQALLHEKPENGQRHIGALAQTGGIEMDIHIIRADSHTDNQLGRVAYKPAVRLVLGRSGFSRNVVSETVNGTKPPARPFIHNRRQNILH